MASDPSREREVGKRTSSASTAVIVVMAGTLRTILPRRHSVRVRPGRHGERPGLFRTVLSRLDEAAGVLLEGVAGGLPEADRVGVVAEDDRADSDRALLAEPSFALGDETERDSSAPVLGQDGEPIHVPAPAVPAGDQRPDDPAVRLGHEQRAVAALDQRRDVPDVGRHARRGLGTAPEIENRLSLRGTTRPDDHASTVNRVSTGADGPATSRRPRAQPSRDNRPVIVEVLAAALICLDPGHGTLPAVGRQTEPIGPGSRVVKIKDGGGAPGEAQVALAIALRTRALLIRSGLRVALTRTSTT